MHKIENLPGELDFIADKDEAVKKALAAFDAANPPMPLKAIHSPKLSSPEEKEKRVINEKLIKHTMDFISFVQRTLKNNSNPDDAEMVNTANEKAEQLIVEKYIEYENAWKVYCGKTFKYLKPNRKAFELAVAQNINMSGLKGFKR